MARARLALLAALAVSLPFSIAGSSLIFFPLLAVYLLGAPRTFRRYPPRWGTVEKAFALFFGVTLISALYGVSPHHSLKTVLKDLYFLMFVLVAALVPSREERWRLAAWFTGASAAAGLLGLLQFGIGINQPDNHSGLYMNLPGFSRGWPNGVLEIFSMISERAVGTRSHPITFAEGLVLAIPAAAAGWMAFPARRGWCAAALALLMGGLVVSQSRGPWLAAGILWAAILLLHRSVPRLFRVGMMLLPVLLILSSPVLRQRAASIVDPSHPSNAERLRMWKAGLSLWKAYPWLGTGPGNVKLAISVYQNDRDRREGPWGHLHNTFIHMLAERGALGLAAFLAWMAAIGRFAWRRWRSGVRAERPLGLMGLLALIGFLACGFTERLYGDAEIVMTFFFILGLI